MLPSMEGTKILNTSSFEIQGNSKVFIPVQLLKGEKQAKLDMHLGSVSPQIISSVRIQHFSLQQYCSKMLL